MGCGSRAQIRDLAGQLAQAGFPAAREEARSLIDASGGDPAVLADLAARRCDGEPLEWLTGFAVFMGHRVAVRRGVYVPRPQTEMLARRAVDLLPDQGVAADLCTGSGAIALSLTRARPAARVVATDLDPSACRCAALNGIEVYEGHLAEPLPAELFGRVDVIVAVVPYVPTGSLEVLPRDVLRHEPRSALDGGVDGTDLLEPVVVAGSRLLRPGGTLLVEVGGAQDRLLAPALAAAGFGPAVRICDEEGDLRGLESRLDQKV